jgi:hypothetical protein
MQHLRKITTWRCPSLPTHESEVEDFALMIEIFIMLHEFGHVVLKHLSAGGRVTHLAGDLLLYTNSEMQEFEADEFAYQAYCSLGFRGSDVAFASGLLMHFFHLCEVLVPPSGRTHPPALHRWRRIKDFSPLSTYPDSWANYLDDTFAVLSQGLHPL